MIFPTISYNTFVTLCIAFTKQLLGSLVGEGAELSPVVDGDAVDDEDDDDD